MTDELVRGQAQHLIGALISHKFLPISLPTEEYIILWDVVMKQLKVVNQEGARAIEAAATAPLLERIAALEAKLAQRVPSEPAKEDHRKLQLQGLILAAVRLGLAQPSEALLHQLDRLIDFYEDDKFADALRLLRHSVRNPKPAGRRIPLVPSAAPAAPEQQEPKLDKPARVGNVAYVCQEIYAPCSWDECKNHCAAAQSPLQRAIDLNEKASMPWDEAEKLALEEAWIGDAEIDELIGNASPSAIVTMLEKEEVREFVRSILVHQHALVAQAPNAQQAEPMCRIAKVKLADLIANGYRECGVMIDRTDEDGTVQRGAVSNGGMVIWWHTPQLKAAQQAEAQEPFAFAYEYIHGKTLLTLERQEGWSDNEIQLFTRPQPAQLQALSEEEIVTAWRGVKDVGDDKRNAILLSEAIQSALAAKNWAVLT